MERKLERDSFPSLTDFWGGMLVQGEAGDSGQGWEERFSGIITSSMSLFQLKTKHVPYLNKLES